MINTSNGLPGIVGSLVGIFNLILPVLTAAAVVFFFIGVVKYIRHEGEHENRDAMLWSLIAIFVLLSFWGILAFMCRSFIGTASCQNGAGSSYSSGGGGTRPPIY